MFCKYCGSNIEENAASCPNCSAPFVPYEQNTQIKTNPNDTISMWQYLGMFLLMMIPIASIVVYIIWAFNTNIGINKRNFAKAYLIYIVIAVCISIVVSILVTILIMPVVLSSIFHPGYYYPY